MMTQRITFYLTAILLGTFVVHAQHPAPSFSQLEKAVREERAGWSGSKERLSTAFNTERRRLGDSFESELLKWLGNDPEKHYWISIFLEAESYLHGNKRLPHLSLLVKQQGLVLARGKDDDESQRFVVRLSITAAVLSSELGFTSLARTYKNEAEALLLRQPELSTSIPGMYDAERQRYEAIESTVSRKVPTVVADSDPQPKAQVSGGVLNGRAIDLVKPIYPAEAYKAGASGTVEVRIVFDETGKVIWARVLSGNPLLRQASEDAAWQTTFPPLKLSGQLVKVSGVLIYNFVR